MKSIKDNIKTLIVILIICLICISLVLLLNRKNNYERLHYVTEYNEFFAITNYINKYVNNISNKDNEAIISLLDNKYLEKNDGNVDNIFNIIDIFTNEISVNITEMKCVEVKKNKIYYVKGNLIKNTFENSIKLDDIFESLVLIDYNTSSFSIYPIDNNFKKVINKIKEINIENNEYNSTQELTNINKERICSLYLSDFVNMVFNKIDDSYNNLSDTMKDKYSNIELFKKFINENKISSTADKCRLEIIDNKRVYYVIDKLGNNYKFEEDYIMNYKADIYIKNNITKKEN